MRISQRAAHSTRLVGRGVRCLGAGVSFFTVAFRYYGSGGDDANSFVPQLRLARRTHSDTLSDHERKRRARGRGDESVILHGEIVDRGERGVNEEAKNKDEVTT